MQHVIQIENGIIKHVSVSVKIIKCKSHYSWNPSTCIYEGSQYLKGIVDNSKIVYDEIIYIMDIVSTNVTNTTPVNVTSTVLIRSNDK